MENAGEDAKETGLSCRWTFVIREKSRVLTEQKVALLPPCGE